MLFPKNRLSLTKTYQGKTDAQGWLVLDLSAIELEGVKKIYLPIEDVAQVQAKGEVAEDKLKKARALLDWDSEEEEAN
jgi:hypothetical protein